MIQLILHLIGDYITQSDWMANNKTKNSIAAGSHALVYSLPFLLLKPSLAAFLVILVTHFFIDRFRLARFVVYAKNRLLQPEKSVHWTDELHASVFEEHEAEPEVMARVRLGREWDAKWKWSNCSGTGYPSETPPWLAVWLLIAADNTLHLAINYAALAWL